MALLRKVIRRGIWKSETISAESSDDFTTLAEEAGWDRSLEDRFRDHISKAIEVATKVLENAGHPTRNGVYTKLPTGDFQWLADFGTNLRYENEKSYHAWPYFLPVERLTLEDFAINLIHNARGFLERMEKEPEKWDLATMSLHYADALLKFTIESSGIAGKALAAVHSAKGAKKARASRSDKRNYALNVVKSEAAKLPVGSPELGNAKRVARAIEQAVNRQLKPRLGKPLKLETIQRYIQDMKLTARRRH